MIRDVLIFSIPFAFWTFALLLFHSRNMAALRLRMKRDQQEITKDSFAQVRDQITALRDTAAQYDTSFDQALQRLEARVGSFDQRISALARRGQQMNTPAR